MLLNFPHCTNFKTYTPPRKNVFTNLYGDIFTGKFNFPRHSRIIWKGVTNFSPNSKRYFVGWLTHFQECAPCWQLAREDGSLVEKFSFFTSKNRFIYRHFNFDLEETLYFFTAGRYEFTNKGADLFIEALARLNHYIKVSYSRIIHFRELMIRYDLE